MVDGQSFANGTAKAEVRLKYVFTSAATGKSFVISGAAEEPGTATDNSDGTITFVSTFRGLPEKLSILNGPILFRDAGNLTISQIYDIATGNLISQVASRENGPHPGFDSGGALFCDVIVPALT